MKTIEIRTHADKDENEQPTPVGIRFARKVGQSMNMNQYQLFYEPGNDRCRKTLIAFGAPEDKIQIDDRFGPLPDEKIKPFHKKGAEIKEVGEFFTIPEIQNLLKEIGEKVIQAILEIASQLPEEGHALVVSHGGAIVPAAHLIQKLDFSVFKKIPDCGGVKFFINQGKITGYEIVLCSIVL